MSSKLTNHMTVIILTAMAAIALSLAACGGDDEKTSDDSDNEPTATSDSGNNNASPTEEAGDDPAGLFRSRAGDHETVSGKVAYTLSSTGGGASSMTLYSKGDKSRIDLTGDDGSVTIIIETADTSYVCSADQCIESSSLGAGLVDAFSGLFDASAISEAAAGVAGVDIDTFEEDIAGLDAQCFTISSGSVAGQGEGEATWCFADDGLLLRATFSGGGQESSLEATEVFRDLSDADFEPPYEVVELPGS